jgi:hypothetical protein
MLDHSVVLSRGVSHGVITLSPASPDRIISGGSGGATTTVIAGPVLWAEVDPSYQPATSWAQLVSGAPFSVAANKRVAVRMGGASVSVLAEPVWA